MTAKAIKVFTDVEAEAAVNSGKVLSLSIRKDRATGKPKEYQGTIFMNAKYKINGSENEGWFTITQDIPLSRGVADPADKDDGRNKFAGTRCNLETKRSMAGPIGRFFDKLNEEWIKLIEDMNEKKELIKGSRKIHELMQYKLSEDRTDELAGALIDDPILRFQVEAGVFSQEYIYHFLRGQSKTIFLDARTAYKDANGATQYKLAQVIDENENEVPVTIENMHRFITSGSILKAGSRIMMPSGARSAGWISLPIIINKAIIEPRVEVQGFSDEISFDTVKTEFTSVLTTTTTSTFEDAEEFTSTAATNKQIDEIANILVKL